MPWYDAGQRALYLRAPIAGGLVRKLIRQRIGVRRVRWRHLEWEVRPGDNATDRGLWLDRVEEASELDRWTSLLRGRTVRFADIGANCGLYAISVAAVAAADSRIVAFEPNPEMRARIETNARLNRLNSIEVAPEALSDRPGAARLVYGSKFDFGQARLGDAAEDAINGVAVTATTLLAAMDMRGFQRFDAVKIDVEGAEDKVLGPFLSNVPDERLPEVLQIERLSREVWSLDVIDLARRRGFEEDFSTDWNVLLTRNASRA
jgi:FkbM family methyltransferase